MTKQKPLCVDMDGTLLRTDFLIEVLWKILYQHPLSFILLLRNCFNGLANFKHEVAKLAEQLLDLSSI